MNTPVNPIDISKDKTYVVGVSGASGSIYGIRLIKALAETLARAGAVILPSSPSFYTFPQTMDELADTVVSRILDHLGAGHDLTARWADQG